MKIVVAASEAVPFAKTGGLADVSTALSKAFAEAGHQVTLILPHYPQIEVLNTLDNPSLTPLGLTLDIPIGSKHVKGKLWHTRFHDPKVDVYLVDQPEYFDRPNLYHDGNRDYRDNCERFVFLSRAVLETIRLLNLQTDVIHCHDWQTGLVPSLLRIEYRHLHGFERTASVFTVHNVAFQGQFWHWDMVLTGLDWKYFNWHQMEFFGNLNLLKTGIVFADMVTTVSPTYAREIQTPELGCGLHGVLRARSGDLIGILNGIDTSVWNPATDPRISPNYDAENVVAGKAACKAVLQRRLGLPIRPDVPLFAMISRLTDQKGLELILSRADRIFEREVQLAFLGTGEDRYASWLQEVAARHPQQCSVTLRFDETLAHQMEAGADGYLMPSRFEPCGLNQMYSLNYGTVPLVHGTGGLADTVIDATPAALIEQTANGFVFRDYDALALEQTLWRALDIYERDQPVWRQLIRNGMQGDWSWNRSAAQYVRVFERARGRYQSDASFTVAKA